MFVAWIIGTYNGYFVKNSAPNEPNPTEQTETSNLIDPDTNRYYITQKDTIFGDSVLIMTKISYYPVNREPNDRDCARFMMKYPKDSLYQGIEHEAQAALGYVKYHMLCEEIDNTEKEIDALLKKKKRNKFLPSFFPFGVSFD